MFRLITLLGFLVSLKTSLCSQEVQREFGHVTHSDLEMLKYSADPNAEALVLFDLGKSSFQRTDEGFNVVFERHTRIKIFSEAGIKWAECEIPFYQQGSIYEIINQLEANSYNLNNGVIKKTSVDVKNAYNEKINEFWNVKKIAIPDVKPGTIIEFRYRLESQYILNLRDWEFQWDIPVLYSEYEVGMIPFFSYSWLLQGANKFDYQTSYEAPGLEHIFGYVKYHPMIHKYVMRNIPAFKDEEFIATKNDYIIKLNFQLSKVTYPDGTSREYLTTWDKMIFDLMKDISFQGYAKKSESAAGKIINFHSLEGKTSQEKFDFVMDFMKSNFKWNERNSLFTSKSPSEFVKDKYGNCAEINLFTVGALNRAGIESCPVIISTREHGKIKYDYPFHDFFNYVLIMVTIDGKNVLTDATESMCLNQRIPPRCINDKGLIIRKSDKPEWVGLECLFPSEIVSEYHLNFNDNFINGSINKTFTEYDGLYCRYNYTDRNDEILKKLDSENYDIIDTSLKILNYSEFGKPYVLEYDVQSSPEKVLENIYLHPFLYQTPADNPLKQSTKTYPIDMVFPNKRIYHAIITIPEGYVSGTLPSPEDMTSELVDMKYSAVKKDDQTIDITFEYYFKKSVYQASDYQKIKTFYNFIVKKGNEKIVLVKNSGS